MVGAFESFDGFRMSELTIDDQRLKPIAGESARRRALEHDDRHQGFTARRTCWRLAGWRITCARKSTGTSPYFNVKSAT